MSQDLNSIFEQISNLKSNEVESIEISTGRSEDDLREILNGVSDEIQRVLDAGNLTQEDLCHMTHMSQSNISKIMNGKVVPRIETLRKIAAATNTRLVISFESFEGENQ